jgi:small subunit ribosomal protein S6
VVNEIERFFRIDDSILKYMTVLLDKNADIEKIKEEVAARASQAAAPKEQAAPSEVLTLQEQTQPAESPVAEPGENEAETIPTETEEENK